MEFTKEELQDRILLSPTIMTMIADDPDMTDALDMYTEAVHKIADHVKALKRLLKVKSTAAERLNTRLEQRAEEEAMEAMDSSEGSD